MATRLTPELLARTALQLLDRDGAGALSMRRLAGELGVDPMAAYRHLPNKDALLDAVVDTVLADVDVTELTTARAESGARAGMRALVDSVLGAIARHPGAAPLLSARAWTTPHGWTLIDWGLETLLATGVDTHRAVLAMNATGLFLTAVGQAEAAPHVPLTTPDSRVHPTAAALVASGEGTVNYGELVDFWERLVFAELDSATGR